LKRITNYVDEAHNEVPKARATYAHEAVYDNAGRLISDTWRQLTPQGPPVAAMTPAIKIKPLKP
jgi:hypothetical protein